MRISLLFVFLWSSAYIAIEYCSADVEPATFVVLRAAITAIILVLVIVVTLEDWPNRLEDILYCAVVGILIHGVYAGSVFASIYHGINVSLCAVVLSLQPILTVILSNVFLDERITKRKTVGVILGFVGVAIVVFEGNIDSVRLIVKGGYDADSGNGLFTISLCFLALLAISSATIIQKRFASNIKPAPATCIQYIAAAIFMLPIALSLETMQINWSTSFVLGLGWLVVFVSIGAMCLLIVLIKNCEAGSVANLFYLVTPLVTIKAWILFGDEISKAAFFGILLCTIGVVVVNFSKPIEAYKVPTRLRRKLGLGHVSRNGRL